MPDKKSSEVQVKDHMQLAEILSDITSLRVCDPKAALALVSARPSPDHAPSEAKGTVDAAADDADLTRAKDLVELHYRLREAHKRGELSSGLEEARAAVGKAVRAG
ncbi:hypothetical protein BU24DRAFT_410989 [Aaosphaeria arxii CBS 175.79]|uniref:Uncharacterized protein n=1 Tax=Aaosphaeria arxii CBS 175.79 TaxID=1450172 RepID=A0A6A5XK51_9PLEO|nr:uncharacterized protein BU24DRAFT_410989 [Aaosphaeria arxii CBS 175.79]KAF2013221.1 hypothetical protein BU24DRAFT_410989 [Aaosphaeria arxii CBS 175.79]